MDKYVKEIKAYTFPGTYWGGKGKSKGMVFKR